MPHDGSAAPGTRGGVPAQTTVAGRHRAWVQSGLCACSGVAPTDGCSSLRCLQRCNPRAEFDLHMVGRQDDARIRDQLQAASDRPARVRSGRYLPLNPVDGGSAAGPPGDQFMAVREVNGRLAALPAVAGRPPCSSQVRTRSPRPVRRPCPVDLPPSSAQQAGNPLAQLFLRCGLGIERRSTQRGRNAVWLYPHVAGLSRQPLPR